MLKLSFLMGILVLAVSACGTSPGEDDLLAGKTGVALIRLASGNLVKEDCLKEALEQDIDPNMMCQRFTPNNKTGSRGIRGTSPTCTNCGGSSTYPNTGFTTYYYVVNPWYYQPTQFCGYYGSSCYNYVYPQYRSYDIDIDITYYQPYRRPNCYYSYGYGSYNSCGSYQYWW